MIQKVTKDHPIGELWINTNDKEYMVKVLLGGSYGTYKERKTTEIIAMVSDGNDISSQILPFVNEGYSYDFTIEFDGLTFHIVCDDRMSITVK